MATTISIPIEVFEILERKLGREDAKEVIKVIEKSLDTIDAKAEEAKTEVKRLSEDLALQKKLELKDELTKELATKADILLTRQEMQTLKVELEGRIDNVRIELESRIESLNTKLNVLIILTFIALTLMNPVMADIIKSFLK